DILPTFASVAGMQTPAKPLDGVDITDVLRGYATDVERSQPFLYFDGWDAQCSRLGKWKLHFARRNDFIYSPSPQGGPKTLALRPPELYNLELDRDESYDVAPENPIVVERLMAQTETMLAGFPQEVKDARTKVLATPTGPGEPGRLPREEISKRNAKRACEQCGSARPL